MTSKEFESVFDSTMKRSYDVLIEKAKQYAIKDISEDRLRQFKVLAELEGKNPKEVLTSLMAKHTLSVFDLARTDASTSLAMWEEKITDHINYLVLLEALVREEKEVEEGGWAE